MDAQPQPLDLLVYQVHTVYQPPAGEPVDATVDAVLFVPALVDVDGSLTPDLLVQVTIDAGRATLRAIPLLTAPSPLPLSVEAILADPRQSSNLRVAFGYDALASVAPAAYDATIALVGAQRVTSFSLDLHTAAAGETLGVFAEVFTRGPNGERLDPQRGRIDFAPVPTTAHFGVIQGSDLGLQQSGLDLASDVPTRATVVIEDLQGSHRVRGDALIDKLPNLLSLTLADAVTGQRTWDYRASDRVGLITLAIRETNGGAITDEFVLRLGDMARNVILVQDTATHARLQTDSAIGVLEAGLSQNRAVAFRAEPAYLALDDDGATSSLAFRILGLERAELGTGDPFLIDVTVQPGPFHVVVHDGGLTIDAWIRDLPNRVRIESSAAAGTIAYAGSAPISELTIDAHDPAGLTGRASTLHLLVRDLPTALNLSFAESAGRATIDARPAQVGLLEVQLTSGPDDRLDPSVDGILLRDLADRYVLFGRITGLRNIDARLSPPDVLLETAGGRVFQADLNQGGEYVRATLDRLVPVVRVRLIESAGRQEISYAASAPTNLLSFDTNSGDRWNLHAQMSGPVPATFTLCQSSNGACTNNVRSAGAGAIRFVASEHTSIEMFDCVRPNNSSCPSSPTEFTRVESLRIRYLEADADATSIGDSGYIFMNTTDHAPGCSPCRHPMSGHLLNQNGSGGGFEMTFPAGFSADNRMGRWDLFGLIKTKTGSINCPSGTSLRVRVFGFWIGVTSFLC